MEKMKMAANPVTPRGASRYSITLANGKTKIHTACWQSPSGDFVVVALNGNDPRRFRGTSPEEAMQALVNYFEKR
jgi:hypothetical protein